MKRAIFAITAAATVALGACSAPTTPEARTETAPTNGWTRPPTVLAVRRGPATLIFDGEAQRGARVVLRNDDGAAYAAVADENGRFEIRMTAPPGVLLLRPETQIGQDAAPSPDRLLIVDGGRGPIAVLRAGGPTRRLDAAPALGAIDSDGRTLLASGRTAAAQSNVAVVAGGEAVRITSDAAGRWSAVLGPAQAAEAISVAGVAFVWPGAGAFASDGALTVERAGKGWRAGWSGPAGARQWTWMPDA